MVKLPQQMHSKYLQIEWYALCAVLTDYWNVWNTEHKCVDWEVTI